MSRRMSREEVEAMLAELDPSLTGGDTSAVQDMPEAPEGVRAAGAPDRQPLPVPAAAPAPAAPPVDDMMLAARKADASSGFRRGIELAGRQMLAGFTHQAPPGQGSIVTAPGSAAADLQGQRNADAQKAAAEKLQALRMLQAQTAATTAGVNADETKRRADKDAADLEMRGRALDVQVSEGEKNRKLREELAKRYGKKGTGGGTGGGKTLPPSMIKDFANYDTAQTQLDELLTEFTGRGMDSFLTRASQGLPNTDASEYVDKSRAVAQGVGTILEGGKLAAGDELKYARMMPQPGDSKERAAQKVENLKRLLQQQRQTAFRDLEASGYKVPKAAEQVAQPAAPAASVRVRRKSDGTVKTLSPEQAAEVLKHDGYERID